MAVTGVAQKSAECLGLGSSFAHLRCTVWQLTARITMFDSMTCLSMGIHDTLLARSCHVVCSTYGPLDVCSYLVVAVFCLLRTTRPLGVVCGAAAGLDGKPCSELLHVSFFIPQHLSILVRDCITTRDCTLVMQCISSS